MPFCKYMFFMFTIANESLINIRSDTDLQNAKNARKFEFREYEWVNWSVERHKHVDRVSVKQTRTKPT